MIEINNLSGRSLGRFLNKRIFSTVAKKVLSGENREKENLSLAFVNKEEIKKLNKKFRQKNKPTDVLSFGISEGNFLGEIVICPEVVSKNAKKYRISVREEMLKVFIHGILHLCGYDHEKSEKQVVEMEQKQEKYLSNLK